MKNIFKIPLVLTLLILTVSCEEDDDTNFVQQNYLAGKWIPVEKGTLNEENILDYLPYENDAQCDLDNVVFNEDFTFSNTDFQYNGTTCESNVSKGDYRKEGRTLILTTKEEIDGVPTEVETIQNLVSLTYDTMEISYTDENTNAVTFIKLVKAE
ncbi:hypothetical protein FEDK69T_10050 [Flavobacterium enshiense DK69]|uniref:Lipocalin-like domain-containing protein n=1 Tax=Flavobacterium enshiense DK69 TaxID=1107311 RepID=V6SB88_9FLAO|nr:hypothetical protein [Flavobacterium enshiense]ESU23948.1 hypothetical protein FEDK69T_10050 [Flavobacterium enshiense DK69]KGO96259.1 hypothetical protein Q767_08395 [Flavobacterium enshiense DK69]